MAKLPTPNVIRRGLRATLHPKRNHRHKDNSCLAKDLRQEEEQATLLAKDTDSVSEVCIYWQGL